MTYNFVIYISCLLTAHSYTHITNPLYISALDLLVRHAMDRYTHEYNVRKVFPSTTN